MQPVHTGEPVARSADALARPAANNMPLSEHDTQELRRLLNLKAEGIERQERLQYLRQTWKYSIWSAEDDESYTLPDPEIPLVYSLHYGQQCPPEWDDGTVPAETTDRHKKKERGKSNLHAEEDFLQKLESLNLDPRLKKLLMTYEEVFGALPPPLSCKKLVQMDLKLKPEFEKTRVRRRPYPAPQEQVEEIERQIQECIDAGLVEEYKHGDYPHRCSPCFLVAQPGSTALRLVVDYGEGNKKTQNHSGSIPNMENTLERIAKCRYKTKMDKRSGFWQVDLTAAAQELLAFITPKGRVFKWKVMPFGVANAPALFQELMNKILYILRRRPLVQELGFPVTRIRYGRIRQDTAGYGRIRQDTAGYGRIRQDTAGYGRYGRIRQDTAGYGKIQQGPKYLLVCTTKTTILRSFSVWWYFILFLHAYCDFPG